jgi:hypothetical protein
MISCESLLRGIAHLSGEAIAATVGAFAGAGAAFALQMVHEKRLKADKEYAAIINAQHALLFMLKILTGVQNQHLDAEKSHPDRHIRLTEFLTTEKHVDIDLASLNFLFRPNMRELISRCFYAERSFLNAFDSLRDRNAVWKAIRARPGAVSEIDPKTGIGTLSLTNEEIRQLKSFTDQLYRSIEVALSLCNDAFTDLRRCAKMAFPERNFLKGDMVMKPVPNESGPV